MWPGHSSNSLMSACLYGPGSRRGGSTTGAWPTRHSSSPPSSNCFLRRRSSRVTLQRQHRSVAPAYRTAGRLPGRRRRVQRDPPDTRPARHHSPAGRPGIRAGYRHRNAAGRGSQLNQLDRQHGVERCRTVHRLMDGIDFDRAKKRLPTELCLALRGVSAEEAARIYRPIDEDAPDPPSHMLPAVVLLDEPELALHPAAIGLIAAMVKQRSADRQVIVATQSPQAGRQEAPRLSPRRRRPPARIPAAALHPAAITVRLAGSTTPGSLGEFRVRGCRAGAGGVGW